MHNARWDIFCRVVDNYGDAGVCARLARQLATGYGLDVCLWINRPEVLARLWPEVDAGKAAQYVHGVYLQRWCDDSLPRTGVDVVIEAFACDLPAPAVAAMASADKSPLWMNLEYLSAEDWVEGSHGLWSVDAATGLRKVFFFPGFTPSTGGLLREQDLEDRRQAFLGHEREAFLQSLGAPMNAKAHYASVLAYPDAPVADWLASLVNGHEPWVCLIPEGDAWPAAAAVCGSALQAGQPIQHGQLTVLGVPFLSQDDYDRLLWSCDINAVRGEDSFVRAQWAGRPLLWQPYRQAEALHETKLEAFLARYTAGWPLPAAAAMAGLHRDWSRGQWSGQAWLDTLSQWEICCREAANWRKKQSALPDLASKLVQFYTDWL